MEHQRLHTTFKDKLKPKLNPPHEQAREREHVLMRCRRRYTTALEQRTIAYERCGVSLSRSGQEAEVKDIRAALPAYAARHRQVLHEVLARGAGARCWHEVLARRDHACQAFFRRLRAGQTAGYPRCQGRASGTRGTFKEVGTGARRDTGSLVRATRGRSAVRGSRPVAGAPTTVTIQREGAGYSVSFSWAERPLHPLPPADQQTGLDVGLASFATRAEGTMLPTPRCCPLPGAAHSPVLPTPRCERNAERALKTAQRRVSRRKRGGNRRRNAVHLLARAHLKGTRQRQDFHHTRVLTRSQQHDTI